MVVSQRETAIMALKIVLVLLFIALLAFMNMTCSQPPQSITIVPSVERKQGVPDLGDMAYELDEDGPS